MPQADLYRRLSRKSYPEKSYPENKSYPEKKSYPDKQGYPEKAIPKKAIPKIEAIPKIKAIPIKSYPEQIFKHFSQLVILGETNAKF